jgi:hypothetical protein
MLSIAQFCQSINCWPTFFYEWKPKLAGKPQTIAILRVQTAVPTKDAVEIKLPSGILILIPVAAVGLIAATSNRY